MTSILRNLIADREQRYPQPGLVYVTLMDIVLTSRKVLLRHLALPRPEFQRKQIIPRSQNPATGRFNNIEYLSYPWYVLPNIAGRWGPKMWLPRLLGRKLPGDDGNIYKPEAWNFMELGPPYALNRGSEFMGQNESKLRAADRGRCPFARSKS